MRAGNDTQKPQQRLLWARELAHLAAVRILQFNDKAKTM
jgi:hypothetical protein